jgi:DNA uptake protein ComE-like DNA-binding protein
MTRVIALLVALAFALGAGTTLASAQPPKDPPKPQPEAPPVAAKKEALDINSASADELKAVKGIGEADAKKIIENRPYRTKDELVEKKVLSKATYDKIKNQIQIQIVPK